MGVTTCLSYELRSYQGVGAVNGSGVLFSHGCSMLGPPYGLGLNFVLDLFAHGNKVFFGVDFCVIDRVIRVVDRGLGFVIETRFCQRGHFLYVYTIDLIKGMSSGFFGGRGCQVVRLFSSGPRCGRRCGYRRGGRYGGSRYDVRGSFHVGLHRQVIHASWYGELTILTLGH